MFFLLFKVMKLRIISTLKILFTGLTIYFSYLLLVHFTIKEEIDNQNSKQIITNMQGIFTKVRKLDFHSLFEGTIYAISNIPWLLINLLTLPVFLLLLITAILNFRKIVKTESSYFKNVAAPFFVAGIVFLVFWSIGDAQYLGLLARMYSPLLPVIVIGLGILLMYPSNKIGISLMSLVYLTVVVFSLLIDYRALTNWQEILFDMNFGRTVTYVAN
jgi:hypothetical protein